MAADKASLTTTFKANGGHDAPWLVVNADDPVQLSSMLDALTNNGIGATIAAADSAFKGAFNVGAGLGATPVEAPINPAPQAQAPQQEANPWAPQGGVAQAAPTDSNPWGVQQQGAPPQQAAAPAGQNFGGGGDGPMVLGMPARRISGVSKKTGKPWAAWADARPKEATQHITEKTDDPNDPRLAAGAATFWQFIRD